MKMIIASGIIVIAVTILAGINKDVYKRQIHDLPVVSILFRI